MPPVVLIKDEKLFNIWVKSCFASKYLKEGIVYTIENALLALHRTLLSEICSQLSLSEAICTRCSTTQICVEGKSCPQGICDIFRTKIESHHRHKRPSWKYTDATKWCTDPWEIAKCFFSISGNTDTTTVKDLDLNGILHLAINCEDVQSHFDVSIKPPKGIFSEILYQRNISLFHSTSLSNTQEKVEKYIDLLISVLIDKKELVQIPLAQQNVQKLQELKEEELFSTEERPEMQTDLLVEQKEIMKRILENCDTKLYMESTPIIDGIRMIDVFPSTAVDKIQVIELSSEKNRRTINEIIQEGNQGYREFKRCLDTLSQTPLVDCLDGVEIRLHEANVSLPQRDSSDPNTTKEQYKRVRPTLPEIINFVSPKQSRIAYSLHKDELQHVDHFQILANKSVNLITQDELYKRDQKQMIPSRKLLLDDIKVSGVIKYTDILVDNSEDQEQKHSASEWISQDTNGHSVTKRYTDIDNSKDLRDICILHGRTSQEVLEACKSIRLKIIVCSRSFKDVLPMYKPVDPYNIVFVVFCEKESNRSTELPLSVESFDVEYRTIGEYRNEDKDIPIERQLFSEKEERKNLTDILKKTSSHFMHEHSNLNIISASPVKSKAFALKEHRFERKPCIVFYVCLKGYIPIQEEEFPSQLGSYETDVREGAFTLYNDTEPFAQRLKLGCSIGEDQTNRLFGGSWGTLGAFVDLRNKKVGCITSAHVLLDQMKLFGCKNSKIDLLDTNAATTIYQPAPSLVPLTADKQPFGRVTSVVYNTGGNGVTGVEAGLITITDPNRYPDDGQFPKIAEDFNEDNQLNFKSGKIFRNIPENIGQFAFYKYGAKTGLTRGAFRLQAGAVRTSTMHVRDQCELHGQIEVCSVDKKPFAEPGDSGSLVLIALESDINDLHAIGILTGGDTVGSKFYITPIWEVLNALELPLQLKNFDGQLPMETDDSNEGNDSKSSEIVAMKKNIKAVQKNLDKEIKTLNHTVKTEVGNVDKKVDTLGSEMKEKLDTILEAILKK